MSEKDIREMAGVKADAGCTSDSDKRWVEVLELSGRIMLRIGRDEAFLTVQQAHRLITQIDKIASRVDLQEPSK